MEKTDTSPFLNLLVELGLYQYYPDKIQLHDVVKLNTPSSKDLKEIPWFFLKGIISCSMRSRDEFLAKFLEDLYDTVSDIDDDPWNSDTVRENPIRVSIHPLDLTVVVYQCCSPLLKQLFAEKMSLCKLAFPLVINHQDGLLVNLWSTRLCIVEERTDTHKEMSAADMESPIVSVIRLGEISMSKSIIINKLISKKGHDAYHHRNCSLGTSNRTISNGTIESAWCLSIERNVIYLNLRGDALHHTNQVHLLLKLSSVIVVMLPIGMLNHKWTQSFLQTRINNSPDCRVILAFDGQNESKHKARELCGKFREENSLVQKTTLICCLALQDEKINLDIMCKDLNANITKLLNKKSVSDVNQEEKRLLSSMNVEDNQSFSKRLESCDLPGVYVDENLKMYTKYRHMAEELMTLIPQESSNVKELLVPLQGVLLLSLTDALKTANKSSEKMVNKKINDLLDKINEKRIEQANQFTSDLALPFIKTFIHNIKQLYQSDEHYVIFVRYLKIFLDRRSRDVIPGEREKYKKMWDKIQSEQKADNNVSNSMKEDFKACEKNLADASFGLEHLFRELGQIYEALSLKKSSLNDNHLSILDIIPKIVANLLLQGESFELMNGDVGNVPLTWIDAVFCQLKRIVKGKKRVLILSVLGIQSSGKSTLLNTMFGLQFSVSAGRCTRGLYMQLLPVDNKKYDYLLVVDTEGIRAPELKDTRYDHDNELATYVIGIGDVILINIKGENTIELTDILGIVVQALMRLRNVNKTSQLKKRCIFVHQNVAASDASDKMLQQRQNLVEELNERTKEAAEQENVQDIHRFSDILHFNLDTDVIYFPDLWEGSPPMASVNPDYSEHAQQVKDSVLSRPIPGRHTYFTISETVTRMKDLWNGLLNDDFVFSFRNNLELKSYMRIQSKFQEISFELETYINDYVCNECSTELQNQLETSPSTTKLKDVLTNLELKMRRETNAKFKELGEKLENFFEIDEKKDIVIQWKQNKSTQLKELYDRLIPNADKRLLLSAKETKFKLSRDDQIADFETKAYNMAKKLARDFRGSLPEQEIIQDKFKTEWSGIVADVTTDDTEETSQTIHAEIDKILCDTFQDKISTIEHFQKRMCDKLQIFDEMTTLVGSIDIQDIEAKGHFEIRKSILQTFKDFWTGPDNYKCINDFKMQALTSTNLTFKTIDDEIERFSSTTNAKFDSTFVRKLFEIIVKDISKHNKQKFYSFKLTKFHESFIITHISFYLKKKLVDLNSRYHKKFSLKFKVEQHKKKSMGNLPYDG